MRPLIPVALVAAMATAAGAQPPADSATSDSSGAAARRRSAAPAALAAPSPDRWLGGDKLRHFALAGMVQGSGFGLATAAGVRRRPALLSASVATAAVSLAKEWHDRRRGGVFSARDLVWDAAGAALWGVLVARSGR